MFRIPQIYAYSTLSFPILDCFLLIICGECFVHNAITLREFEHKNSIKLSALVQLNIYVIFGGEKGLEIWKCKKQIELLKKWVKYLFFFDIKNYFDILDLGAIFGKTKKHIFYFLRAMITNINSYSRNHKTWGRLLGNHPPIW